MKVFVLFIAIATGGILVVLLNTISAYAQAPALPPMPESGLTIEAEPFPLLDLDGSLEVDTDPVKTLLDNAESQIRRGYEALEGSAKKDASLGNQGSLPGLE